jgi:hypothetical protein
MTLVIVPSRCRRSGFAVFQAFERDNNAIGLQQESLALPWGTLVSKPMCMCHLVRFHRL